MDHIKIPDELKKMNEIFASHGYEAYLVGGAVRDMILGKPASDWDLATNATPEQVMSLFRKVIPTGIAHGTVTVHFLQHEIEVTTYRADHGYSDGRHPDSVTFASTIEDDLSRRDFTMNAIAADLTNGRLVDPFNGRDDIKNKTIRTVGSPRDRFLEDGLRPVRALRFASQLNFCIQKDTYSAISDEYVQKKILSVSVERFRDELCKMLSAEKVSAGLKDMESTGVLALFMPELAVCRGVTQADCRGFHEFDVLDHLIYSCDGAPKSNLNVRLAALFHDIGKPKARKIEQRALDPAHPEKLYETISFHNHEKYSVEITRPLMFRLKFPNAQIDYVCHLIENHMFFYEEVWSDAAVRRFLVRVKPECVNDLFDLRLADIYGMHNVSVQPNSQPVHYLNELSDRIKKVSEEKTALSLKDIAVNGKDLMEIGVPAGKELGRILQELFQTVLDDPAMNTREKLLNVAKHIK